MSNFTKTNNIHFTYFIFLFFYQTFSIANGVKATDYPEAVLINGCSGVLLNETTAVTAAHCKSSSYEIIAPNLNNSRATATKSATTYNGNVRVTLDIVIVYLDAPGIKSPIYPTISKEPPAAGTEIVAIGRTLNNKITDTIWMTKDTIKILDVGTPLGFPFNLQARPDLTQDGDSGGPIMLLGTHTVVGLVDTDTIEQKLNIQPPIDLYSRMDLLHDV